MKITIWHINHRLDLEYKEEDTVFELKRMATAEYVKEKQNITFEDDEQLSEYIKHNVILVCDAKGLKNTTLVKDLKSNFNIYLQLTKVPQEGLAEEPRSDYTADVDYNNVYTLLRDMIHNLETQIKSEEFSDKKFEQLINEINRLLTYVRSDKTLSEKEKVKILRSTILLLVNKDVGEYGKVIKDCQKNSEYKKFQKINKIMIGIAISIIALGAAVAGVALFSGMFPVALAGAGIAGAGIAGVGIVAARAGRAGFFKNFPAGCAEQAEKIENEFKKTR